MTMRLDYVAGVSPAKWLRAWAERHPELPLEAVRVDEPAQLDRLLAGEVDLAFVRLPVDDTRLHVIPLWEEQPVVLLEKDHPFADAEALSLAELEGEPLAPVQDDPAMTIELVAAGTGYAIVPHAVARLHHRRDVVALPLQGAPTTRIALVWLVERDDETVQEFVGVVRGRTARSSRGAEGDPPAERGGSERHRDRGRGSDGGGKPGTPAGSARGGAQGRGASGRGDGTARGGASGRGASGRGRPNRGRKR
ncbi:LysR family transcriptional regulator substrate-binding protein [Agromyces mediolanus]|uniref:LysR family transcriptional regulator substrate-binding protein n=1 Tax=Agromyces mediolanus TaxID=41986 RepID=UPI00203D5095|nr:LysR family transcriptional regulator substrate-binding protein [Agromyces mediolanus]MCM3655632.1 LysR family transcriptional regulator substrate-binding protein [Agromyces mediolanus]